jgi:glycosyltransferase involved in cell wall biosynthesis
MEKSLVSIALCTYNGAAYLSQQLDTLVNQTYPNIEIIVVDDCSTDDTYTILNNYAAKYPQFKIYQNENNLGFVQNFERAVKLCKGELIALCDQDDIWDHQKIQLQVEAIGNHFFVYHDSEFIYQDGSPMNKKMSDIVNMYSGGQPETFLFFNCVSGHAILMKRELLSHALPLKKDYFHDWWFAYVATNLGTIGYIPQCLIKYRQHLKNDTNILRLKDKQESKKLSSVTKIERIQQWLRYCKDFPLNKNQQLVDEFYEAFTQRVNSYVSTRLSALLFKHRKTVLYIRKKSNLNMLNYIYSQFWGLKTKKALSNP